MNVDLATGRFARRRIAAPARLLALLALALPWAPTAQAQDLAMSAILQPLSGCALGSQETVRVRMFNHGPTLATGASFLIAYTLGGNATVNELVTLAAPFQANTSLVHSFAVPADLSQPGDYLFSAGINPAGDLNPGNNTLSGHLVRNSASSVAGTLGGPASGRSGTLTLGPSTGSIVQWEESPDQQRWFKLANDTATQAYADLAATTRFRVRVANGPCPAVVSNVHTVVP